MEDCAEGVVKYKNGAISIFQALNYYSYNAPIDMEIHGEKGLVKMVADEAVISFNDGRELTASRSAMDNSEESGKDYWGIGHAAQIEDFYQSLLKGEKPFIDGEDARKTQALVCAIYQSGRERKKVNL